MFWLQTRLSKFLSPGIFIKLLGFGLLLVFLAMSAMSFLLQYVFDTMLERQLKPIGTWAVHEANAAGSSRDAFLKRIYQRGSVRVTLFDASGKQVASTAQPFPPLNPGELSRLRTAGTMVRDSEDSLAVALQDEGVFAGYGVVDFSNNDSLELGTLVLIPIFAAVGLIAWPITASLTRPVRRLTRAVTAFGDGQFDARVTNPGHDEIGKLGRAFNSMAERIQDSLRSERLLLAAISHELRTPLQRVRLAVELTADLQQENRQLTSVMADLDDLDGILADVLAFARLEANTGIHAKDLLKLEPIPPQELLADCAARFESSYPLRRLNRVVPAELPIIQADARLLRRAMLNLLSNAARYSASDKAIEMEGRSEGQTVVFEIRDSGPGIPADQMDRIFQPFFRGDEARSARGSGLGLPIVKRIVEAHGGRIEVETSPRGSTFRIVLPVG
jgi:two-component system, OmpR family, sensor kinase